MLVKLVIEPEAELELDGLAVKLELRLGVEKLNGLEDDDEGDLSYSVSPFEPPQISFAFPAQFMLHLPSVVA